MNSKALPAWLLALCLGVSAWPALAAGSPFLWSLRVDGVTHYLQGSVHLLPEAAHPLPAALEAAYAGAEEIVFESDVGALSAPEAQFQMLEAARAPGLSGLVPATLYGRVRTQAAALGLPKTFCDPYKAWFCALSLEILGYQRAGFTAELGLDPHYYRRAVEDEKTIGWLEPVPQHLALFTEMPPAMSQQLLEQVLAGIEGEEMLPEALLDGWRNNNSAELEALLRDMRRDYPQVYQRIVSTRNRAWVPLLLQRFRSGRPQLVMVGAAHLIGPDGLVALLRAQGLALTPVP